MKLFSATCLLSIAFAAASCDKGPAPVEPRDPDDITGCYGVNYSIYLDDSPLPVFVSSGDYSGSVTVRSNVDGIELYFRPNDRVIEFERYLDDNVLSFWTNVGFKETAAGNYSFNCPRMIDAGDGSWVPGGSSQTEFVFSHSRPVIEAHAEVTMTGNIVAKDANDARSYRMFQEPDMYHDLDMTIELAPFIPNPVFNKLYIEITSR